MPTYQYRCEKCRHEFEEYQRITAAPLKTCPKCKGKVQRIITGGSGVIFKGSGFYATDYGRKSAKTYDKQKAEETTKSEGTKAGPEKTEKTEKKDTKAKSE